MAICNEFLFAFKNVDYSVANQYITKKIDLTFYTNFFRSKKMKANFAEKNWENQAWEENKKERGLKYMYISLSQISNNSSPTYSCKC